MRTRLAVAAAALLGALATASGCADNNASVQVQMICQPTADCIFTNGCDTQFTGFPTYDPGLATGDLLTVFLQVANQLPNNADRSAGRVNTNGAHVDEIATELEGAVGGTQSFGANGYIPAGGRSVVAVPVVVGTAPLAATGEVLARVRVRGFYDDGSRFETAEFPITIVVCADCLSSMCAGAPTCPEDGEGQRPLQCGEAETTPTP